MTIRAIFRPYHQEPPHLVPILALAAASWFAVFLVALAIWALTGVLF
jgi:hypothetical protein